MRGRAVLRRDVDRALHGVDALLLPALAIEAPPIGAASVPVKGGQEPVRNVMLRCTQLFNVTGHPAISCPAAPRAPGCPSACRSSDTPGRTADLLRVARAVEQALGALMIATFFHRWEQRLADISRTERVVRPFEWGLDWIPATAMRRTMRRSVSCGDWIDGVMADTDAFFTPSPTSDYAFTPGATQLRATVKRAR